MDQVGCTALYDNCLFHRRSMLAYVDWWMGYDEQGRTLILAHQPGRLDLSKLQGMEHTAFHARVLSELHIYYDKAFTFSLLLVESLCT